MIPWWSTKLGTPEREAMVQAFDSLSFTTGKNTAALENQLAETFNIPYAVVTNSGTSALTMSLLAAGIGPGDKVIVPALTWIATAQAVDMVGAETVLVDVKAGEPIMDPLELRQKLDSAVKAIILVHLNGRTCDLKAIKEICAGRGIRIIEDTCKGIGSETADGYLGTLADMGCFSMGMISLVSVGYGGFVLTRDSELFQKLKCIRDHGVVRDPEEYKYRGANFKISDLLASIGLVQLSKLQGHKQAVLRVYKAYREGLQDFAFGQIRLIDIESGKVPIYTEMKSLYRDDIEKYLRSEGIQVSRYHLPLSKASYLKQKGSYPQAELLCRQSFLLPSGPSQPLENVQKTIAALKRWEQQKKIDL